MRAPGTRATRQTTAHRRHTADASGTPPLTVERTPAGYTLHDPLLVRLAGIDAVPLPFTALAPPATVLAHLRRLTPRREVHFLSAEDTPTGRSPLAPSP